MQTGVVNGWRCRYGLQTGKFDVPPLFSNDKAKAVVAIIWPQWNFFIPVLWYSVVTPRRAKKCSVQAGSRFSAWAQSRSKLLTLGRFRRARRVPPTQLAPWGVAPSGANPGDPPSTNPHCIDQIKNHKDVPCDA
jgi:hypothetical protein